MFIRISYSHSVTSPGCTLYMQPQSFVPFLGSNASSLVMILAFFPHYPEKEPYSPLNLILMRWRTIHKSHKNGKGPTANILLYILQYDRLAYLDFLVLLFRNSCFLIYNFYQSCSEITGIY